MSCGARPGEGGRRLAEVPQAHLLVIARQILRGPLRRMKKKGQRGHCRPAGHTAGAAVAQPCAQRRGVTTHPNFPLGALGPQPPLIVDLQEGGGGSGRRASNEATRSLPPPPTVLEPVAPPIPALRHAGAPFRGPPTKRSRWASSWPRPGPGPRQPAAPVAPYARRPPGEGLVVPIGTQDRPPWHLLPHAPETAQKTCLPGTLEPDDHR